MRPADLVNRARRLAGLRLRQMQAGALGLERGDVTISDWTDFGLRYAAAVREMRDAEEAARLAGEATDEAEALGRTLPEPPVMRLVRGS